MKKLLLTLLTLMVSVAMNAERVSKQEALMKARQFMPGKQFGEAKAFSRSTKPNEGEPFYIFNAENNGGFVIVSGDSRMKTILGYSEHGSFDLEKAPSNVRWWLGQYEKAISTLNTTNTASKARRSFTRGTSEAKEAIAPFITTTWGQHAPYNSQCPTYNNENCITGCIATAMAQVMNYTKWPEGATSEIASYTTETLSLSVPKLSATTFNWDSMADDDIARLMRYCGQAVGMNYGLENSSAYDARIPGAMIGKFGYDKSMRIVYRNGYNSETWETMIYNELKAGRPVIYGGQSGDGGHSFICHGYQDGMFYINWGWDGWYDGYFALTALNPDGNGAYGREQTAVIGIQKPTGGAIVSNPMVTVTKVELTSDETASRASSSANFTNIAIKSTLQHAFMEDKTVHVGFALYLGNVLKQVLGYDNIAFSPGLNITFNATFSFGSGLADGTYRIVPVYRESEASDWIADEGSTFRYVEAIVEGTNLKLKVMPDAAHDERLKYNIIRDDEVEVAASGEDIEGDIVIPEVVEIDGKVYHVTAIAHSGFMDCNDITSIKMPSGIKDFGYNCFRNCKKINEITIPKSLRGSYGFAGIFNGCDNLVEIKIEEGNTDFIVLDGALLTADGKGLIDYAPGINLKDYVMPESVEWVQERAFADNKRIESVKLSPKLTYIDYNTFSNCSALKTVYIHEGLISIKGRAFERSAINCIDFPSTLRIIEYSAFEGCLYLETITIPQSVNAIGESAFRESGLKSITIRKASPISINDNVFGGYRYTQLEDGTWEEDEIYNNAILYVPKGRSKYYKESTGWNNFKHLEEKNMPDVIISDNPFENVEENQMILGYYRDDDCSSSGFGGANIGTYKACIGFSKEGFAPFVGNKIKAVRFALTNTDIKNVNIWISSSRYDQPLYSQKVGDIITGWNVIILDEPFEIKKDSFFIGIEYTSDISYNYPISMLYFKGEEQGSAYLYGPYDENGKYKWIDESSRSSLSIQFIVEGNNIPLYDVHTFGTIYKLFYKDNNKYFRKGQENVDFRIGIKNWGKYGVDKFHIKAYIDSIFVGERTYTETDYKSNTYYVSCNIPDNLSVGLHNLKIAVTSVKDNVPLYPEDDVVYSKICVYNNSMKRQKILMQNYTSTWCPSAMDCLNKVSNIIKSNNDVALISFHAEDEFSTEVDRIYYCFTDYVGVIGYDRYFSDNLLEGGELDKFKNVPSFADVNIDSSYDNEKRILRIVVKGQRLPELKQLHNDVNLSIFLSEDNVITPQYDGDNGVTIPDYKHLGVLRTSVSAVWGDPIKWNGDTYEMYYSVKLKDEWIAENMHIVAFIGEPFDGSNYDDINVINCNDFDVKDATAIFIEDDVAYEKQDDNSAAISDNGNAKGEVVIPETVTHEGVEYPVKVISEEAFKGNTDLTLVSIPESIGQIGESAFAGCSSLKAIYSYANNPIALGSGKATVRTRADGGDLSASSVFAEVDKETCILYVPKNSGSKYRAAEGWGEFKNIVEMESAKPGDANNNGDVDSKDIDAIVGYIMEGKTDSFIFKNADVNGDNKVNAADIVLIVNMIE